MVVQSSAVLGQTPIMGLGIRSGDICILALPRAHLLDRAASGL